ncbi:MAG: hypothetical protein R3362_07235, partial [Rhodothermales bacterium]|nr:hypothetical protein [Rhodothermales bacterium]
MPRSTAPLRRLAPPALLLVLATALAGCFQVHTLLRLNADGSGTIEETVAMNGSLMQMLRAAAAEKGATLDASLIDEARLSARAAEFGEGVAFVRAEPLDVLFGGGFRVVYAFEDVNALRLTQDIDSALPEALSEQAASEMGGGDADIPEAEEPVTFTYADGALTVRLPEPDALPANAAVDAGDAAQADSLQQAL